MPRAAPAAEEAGADRFRTHRPLPHGRPPVAAERTSKLQKRLAEAGLGSRRAMEELVQAGKVSVNGRVARIGARVGPDDRITIDGDPVAGSRLQRPVREPRVVLYHKAEGEIVSRSDPEGRPSVFDRVPLVKRGRWLAVGRLDFNTCGLLVFTDSGELANRLTHPSFQVARDYAVRIVGELSAEQTRLLKSGVQLEDGLAKFEVLESQGGEGTNRWYRVRVREGRNRLVRRMFAAIGSTVSRLMRTSFGPFELPPRVKRGQWLRLEPAEVKQLLSQLERDAGKPPASRPQKVLPGRFNVRRDSRQQERAVVAGPYQSRREPRGSDPAAVERPRRPPRRFRAR